jgi:hypothetical protein
MPEVIEKLEEASRGLVDKHCAKMRVWQEGSRNRGWTAAGGAASMERPDSELLLSGSGARLWSLRLLV